MHDLDAGGADDEDGDDFVKKKVKREEKVNFWSWLYQSPEIPKR